jgi:hypothetical protein
MTLKEICALPVSNNARVVASILAERDLLKEFLAYGYLAEDHVALADRKLDKYRAELRFALGMPEIGLSNVYIFSTGKPRRFKIGYSGDVPQRFKALKTHAPDLKCELVMHGNRELELLLQDMFREKRLEGDWFDLNEDDLKKVKMLCADAITVQ